MKLVDILEKAFSKMPNGWGETVKVDLTSWWTAPSDGLLMFHISAQGGVAYVENEQMSRYICAYAYGGGETTTSGVVYKDKKYRISYKGRFVTSANCYFTPFSYRGALL